MEDTKHIPVLLEEAVAKLRLKAGDIAVDATLGGGSHTQAMLGRVAPYGRVIAIDTDAEALKRFRIRATKDDFLREALEKKLLVLWQGNYSDLGGALEGADATKVDGILADLGFSSDQIESAERGLGFSNDGPLDMRLDQGSTLTAAAIVNDVAETELEQIFRQFGDEPESRRIARAIVSARNEKPFRTTRELATLIENAYPKGRRYRMRIHPATKIFQALRIAVNSEFEHLEAFLNQAVLRLKPKGRLAVITFHSGEDRIVKRFFQVQAHGCVCPPSLPICCCGRVPMITILTKKAIVPSEKEITENPRSRSAKLRVVEKA